jgi:hypothetical protein
MSTGLMTYSAIVVVAVATVLVLLYVPSEAAQLPASTCQFSGMEVASVKSVRKNVAVGGMNPESVAAAIVGRIAIRSRASHAWMNLCRLRCDRRW